MGTTGTTAVVYSLGQLDLRCKHVNCYFGRSSLRGPIVGAPILRYSLVYMLLEHICRNIYLDSDEKFS